MKANTRFFIRAGQAIIDLEKQIDAHWRNDSVKDKLKARLKKAQESERKHEKLLTREEYEAHLRGGYGMDWEEFHSCSDNY